MSEPTSTPVAHPVVIVGLVGGVAFGPEATRAIADADVLVASSRHLDAIGSRDEQVIVDLAGPLDAVLDAVVEHQRAGRRVCVLSSGDPGFFGIVRVLAERIGPDQLAVHPAPSSVALAFAAIGRSWDDAVVASAHGRALDPAIRAVLHAHTAAVLTSPANPPEAVGAALRKAGAGPTSVTVVSRLGEADEAVVATDLDGLAAGAFDPMSVVVLLADEVRAPADAPTLAWGRPESAFEHRDGMITKAEVRAVAIAKLALPAHGVLWDVGTGSGSVAVECARLSPGLDVHAIDRDPEQLGRAAANAASFDVHLTLVEGDALDAIADLPDPDRVFIGGGGLDVLDRCLERLRPGGVIVANYALVDRAAHAQRRLGNLVQLSVSRGVPVADLGVRLQAENPVFICWGPT